jgi:alkaline phosphatase
MSPAHKPLLARYRPSSEHSDDLAAEEDALLSQSNDGPAPPSRYGFWREVGLYIWALATISAVVILAVILVQSRERNLPSHGDKGKSSAKRNLIFMVSDGMGPASLSMTRSFRQHNSELPADDVLVLDRYFIGSSRTRSTSSLVTDSAAGATAFSCGLKSYNGAIAMLPDYTPCGTVL